MHKGLLQFSGKREHVGSIYFLTDIFKYINDVNSKLQGKNIFVCDLLSEVKSFPKKMDFLCKDIENKQFEFY